MAHIGESRVLATHLIHTKTQQVLHLLLESAREALGCPRLHGSRAPL